MPSARPTLAEVQAAMLQALARGQKRIVDVAQILCVSKSTLQRTLAAEGTDFTALRKKVQVRVALVQLTQGRSVRIAADRAVIHRDHLCVIVREATGLTPLQILRAAQMSAMLARWRRQGPPAFGSWRYREQMRRWGTIDRQLQSMLADLGPSHPLADWAKKTLVAAQRPDFRTRPYRDGRRREAERRAAQLQGMLERSRRAEERAENSLEAAPTKAGAR